MKQLSMRQKKPVDQLLPSALQKMKRMFFVEGECFLESWLRRLGLKDC
jgi:hypothetical protein